MPTMTEKSWLRLGAIPPTDLAATRLELHWASQLPAAVGIARATPSDDFAHHALTWDAAHHALVSAPVPGRRPYRAGLRLSEQALLLLNGKNSLFDTLPLAGVTLREGLAWLERASALYTGEDAPALARPEHELPDHPVARGAPFGALDAARAGEIARWFESLSAVLRELVRERPASPVRVWSHHFDLDSVLDLGRGRTLGLGFSPGDDSYAEPYLYVLPNPAPDERALVPLPAPMEWVTEGWVGAVLRGSALAPLSADAQAELVERFYRSSVDLLSSSPE
jgi:hypothetical protein